MADDRHSLLINRAPVLTLWAAVVAEHLGFERNEAITLGRAVAGLNAYAKGKALGIFSPTPDEVRKKRKEMDEQFRPDIPSGPGGWGAKGRLDLDKIRALAKA